MAQYKPYRIYGGLCVNNEIKKLKIIEYRPVKKKIDLGPWEPIFLHIRKILTANVTVLNSLDFQH